MKKLLCITISFLSWMILIAQQIAPVFPPTGGFHIEGNLQANTPTVGVGDWIPDSSGGGGYVMDVAGNPVNAATTYHVVDPYNPSSDDIFTSGRRNENPNTQWAWATGSAGNKTDLNNVLVHFTKDSVGCHKWMMFATDRLSNIGTAYVDIELLQNTLTKDVGGGFTSAASNSTGGRTVNDLLISVEYSGGGGYANLTYYSWQFASGIYQYVMFTPPTGSSYAFTSAGGEVVPYGAFGFTTYLSNQFVEGAIDLDATINAYYMLLVDSISFKTLFVKTKPAISDVQLTDFIPPIPLNNLTLSCLIGIDEYSLQKSFTIMPNPAHDKLKVEFDGQSSILNGQIEIYNPVGEKVFHSALATSQHKTVINISSLASGIYFVRLVTEKGSSVKKLVKE